MGQTRGHTLNEKTWALVEVHAGIRKMGEATDVASLLTAALEVLGPIAGTTGMAVYRVEQGALVRAETAGSDASSFPAEVSLRSHLGGLLAGTSEAEVSMVLGVTPDGPHVDDLRLQRDGTLDHGVLWLRSTPTDDGATAGEVLIEYLLLTIRHHRALGRERRRATFDALTGVMTRAPFQKELQREIARAHRTERPFSVLLLDVDNFKSINDTHGHDVGDVVLARLGSVLDDSTRETDAVGRVDGEELTVGRLGGEEFAILLADADLEGAVIVAERVRTAVAAVKMEIEDLRITVTVSVGVAQWTEGETPRELLRRADQAMYAAKNSGRNRVCTA